MPTINYLTRIEFDFGVMATLGAEIEALGLKRPLLVTDRGIADAAFAIAAGFHLGQQAVVAIHPDGAESQLAPHPHRPVQVGGIDLSLIHI